MSTLLASILSGLVSLTFPSPSQEGSNAAGPSEFRFGKAVARAESEWAFRRHVSAKMRCRTWLNEGLARDQDLAVEETVGRTARRLPDPRAGAEGWSVSYKEDTRQPSLVDFTTTAERTDGGELVFPELMLLETPQFQNKPASLLRDHERLGKPHRLAELFSDRVLSPGDEIVVPAEIATDLLGTRIVPVRSAQLEFVEETLLDGVRAGSFRLRARASSQSDDQAGARTELELSGTLVLRAEDAAPMSLVARGPFTVDAEWTERIDAMMRVKGEGTARVELRWGPLSILEDE